MPKKRLGRKELRGAVADLFAHEWFEEIENLLLLAARQFGNGIEELAGPAHGLSRLAARRLRAKQFGGSRGSHLCIRHLVRECRFSLLSEGGKRCQSVKNVNSDGAPLLCSFWSAVCGSQGSERESCNRAGLPPKLEPLTMSWVEGWRTGQSGIQPRSGATVGARRKRRDAATRLT